MSVNKQTLEILNYLKLDYLKNNWDEIIKRAEKEETSYQKLLQNILAREYEEKVEKVKSNKIIAAKIPNSFTIATYPFDLQPHLDKKRIFARHDSLDFVIDKKSIIFIGKSGSGKTGLASSFLRQAINNGHSGRFVEFRTLMEELLKSIGDRTEKKLIHRYSKYDCLVIDDLSFTTIIEKGEANLFNSLIQKRYKHGSTIITTPLGIAEWDKVFSNAPLTESVIGRLTDNGHILTLKNCGSVRPKCDVD